MLKRRSVNWAQACLCRLQLVLHMGAPSVTQACATDQVHMQSQGATPAAACEQWLQPAHDTLDMCIWLQELDATTARLLQSEDRAARAQAQVQQAAAQTRDARAQAAQVSQTLQASLGSRFGIYLPRLPRVLGPTGRLVHRPGLGLESVSEPTMHVPRLPKSS